jgi:hypothetical protein
MSKRLTSGIVAAVAAIAMSMPTVGLANKGGVAHHTPINCHIKKHGKHSSKSDNSKGNKCGKTATP